MTKEKKPGMPGPIRLIVLVIVAVAIFILLFLLVYPLITPAEVTKKAATESHDERALT
jgi:hypothetical protein